MAAEGYIVESRHTSTSQWLRDEGQDQGLVLAVAQDDVLVAVLRGSNGRFATPLLYVVDTRVSSNIGVHQAREIKVTLSKDVVGTQPLEGDCVAGNCQCNQIQTGFEAVVRVPGGSAQLLSIVQNTAFNSNMASAPVVNL